MNHIVIRSNRQRKFFDIFTSHEGWDRWSRYQLSGGIFQHVKGRVLSAVESKYVKGVIQ